METLWEKQSQKKYIPPENLPEFVENLRSKNHTIVTLNGSFDLLHAGHLQILYEASLQGSILFVCLNTDESIRGYKGSSRPIVPLQQRMQMISALEFVDYVTWFEELFPNNVLEKIRPDVHVNGSEYKGCCPEEETILSGGGIVHFVPLVPGSSTSNLVRKIQQCE